MSRLIKMTPEYIEECRSDFEKALQLAKLSDGKLNFTKTFSGEGVLYPARLGQDGHPHQ